MGDQFTFDVFLSHSSKDKAVVRPLAERLRKDGLKVWFDEWEIKPGDSAPTKIEEGLEDSRVLVLCMSASAFGVDVAGRPTLSTDDLVDLQSFAKRLVRKERAIDRYIALNLSSEIKAIILKYRIKDPQSKVPREKKKSLIDFTGLANDSRFKVAIIEALNRIVRGKKIYTAERFVDVDVHKNTKHLISKASELIDIMHLNRRLLEDAYPDELSNHWIKLEAGTFRFRDPLNDRRRFIPLRLDNTPIENFLPISTHIDWRVSHRKDEYSKLSEACKPPPKLTTTRADQTFGLLTTELSDYAFSEDGKQVITAGDHPFVQLWNLATGDCLRVFEGHTDCVRAVAWNFAEQRLLTGSDDGTVRLWDSETGECQLVFNGHQDGINCVVWSQDRRFAISGADDATVRLWDANTGQCLRIFSGHRGAVWSVAWSSDQKQVISGSDDETLRLWDVDTGECLRSLQGHTSAVYSVAWNGGRRRVISGSDDTTLRLWDVDTGRCLRIFEGHTGAVRHVQSSGDQRQAFTGSDDGTIRLWSVDTGRCLSMLRGHLDGVCAIAWSAHQHRAFSGDKDGGIRVWNLKKIVSEAFFRQTSTSVRLSVFEEIQYTNAKVLLVGETSAGKTGLSKRLALGRWEPSDSTIGAWATQWKLPVESTQGVEREIWLWDFGGQADQRLIHQLYMDETALAVLVFDGQKEDLFETLGQWDRDLTRASRKEFVKLLVAGRVDAGGLRASRSEVEKFAVERKFRSFLETSAKRNLGCKELRQAILDAIPWDELPCRTTEVLFKRLKEEIISLKDEGRVLMRFNELREKLQLNLSGEFKRFADEELRAVLTLLAGPGVVWELAFGSWVLLQPERINAYAQAVIRTLQADEHQRGCLMEERVLKGDLLYESSAARLQGDEERFVLLAMHQTLVERGLCLRQPTTQGNLLVFPSYYRKERPDIVQYPAVQVNYRFTGFLDELYATLVVRLHHCDAFKQDGLWRYAADFKTNTGKQLGIKLTRRAPGVGELEVYFDPAVSMEEKIIFSKYVHVHLLEHAREVERLRNYVCPQCNTAVGNRDVAMKRLNEWLRGRPPETAERFRLRGDTPDTPSVICVGCEGRVPLWDDMEHSFASAEIQQRVRDMQEESAIELSNQSKERALVGEVISTVALADQISREHSVSDHGIDMEIEFVDDVHEATNRKIYLQLKSGDSYIRKSKKDGSETFTIKDERHVRYWMASAFPVLLVIRNSEGEVRWMEVRDWLKRASENGKKPVKQIVFEGERFDVMSVRRWREKVLGGV